MQAEVQERKTYEDYLNTPEGERYQLIEGELILTPSPSFQHQEVSFILSGMVRDFLVRKKIGRAVAAPMDVVFDDDNVLQPDLVFVSKARESIITIAGILGAPDLVVEILSPSTGRYDLQEKKRIYERFGVMEYWIIDPMQETLQILVSRDHQFEQAFSGQRSGRAKSEVLPGFSVELEELFMR